MSTISGFAASVSRMRGLVPTVVKEGGEGASDGGDPVDASLDADGGGLDDGGRFALGLGQRLLTGVG